MTTVLFSLSLHVSARGQVRAVSAREARSDAPRIKKVSFCCLKIL